MGLKVPLWGGLDVSCFFNFKTSNSGFFLCWARLLWLSSLWPYGLMLGRNILIYGRMNRRRRLRWPGLVCWCNFSYACLIFISSDICLPLFGRHRFLMVPICFCIGAIRRRFAAEIWVKAWCLCCLCLFRACISLSPVWWLLRVCMLKRSGKSDSPHNPA